MIPTFLQRVSQGQEEAGGRAEEGCRVPREKITKGCAPDDRTAKLSAESSRAEEQMEGERRRRERDGQRERAARE